MQYFFRTLLRKIHQNLRHRSVTQIIDRVKRLIIPYRSLSRKSIEIHEFHDSNYFTVEENKNST